MSNKSGDSQYYFHKFSPQGFYSIFLMSYTHNTEVKTKISLFSQVSYINAAQYVHNCNNNFQIIYYLCFPFIGKYIKHAQCTSYIVIFSRGRCTGVGGGGRGRKIKPILKRKMPNTGSPIQNKR